MTAPLPFFIIIHCIITVMITVMSTVIALVLRYIREGAIASTYTHTNNSVRIMATIIYTNYINPPCVHSSQVGRPPRPGFTNQRPGITVIPGLTAMDGMITVIIYGGP